MIFRPPRVIATSLLLLVTAGCASLDTFLEDFGSLADPVLDEALADDGDGAPNLGRAIDRSTADAIDADAARLASLENEMTCAAPSFEDFFQREFEVFLRWRGRERATSETQRATYRAADLAIGRDLRGAPRTRGRMRCVRDPPGGALLGAQSRR